MKQNNLNWKESWSNSSFRWQFILTIAVLLGIAFTISKFFSYIENRKGFLWNDPILGLFDPVPVSAFTFSFIYGAVIVGLIFLIPRPQLLLKGFQGLAVLLLIRMLVLYLVPLEAPAKLLPLYDPFIEKFFYGETRITKDLFFSGHV